MTYPSLTIDKATEEDVEQPPPQPGEITPQLKLDFKTQLSTG